MATIKNKQTGETLTGAKYTDTTDSQNFSFRIAGTTISNVFRIDDWEILPPPLPTGIGAVVRTSGDVIYTRVNRTDWRTLENAFEYKNSELEKQQLTVLSEGVAL